jgi:HK97 gp10 family phage protein
MSFELTGMDEMLAELERIGSNVDDVVDEALHVGAEIIRESAKQKCPRSTKQGRHLADNIIISDVKKDSNNKAYVDVGVKKSDNSEFFYGKNLPLNVEIH